MTRKLVVSNQDNQIHYEGGWSRVTNSSLFQTLAGTPLGSSLQEAMSNDSSFSFAFNGTSIDVLGLNLVDNDPPSQSGLRCSIDGSPMDPASDVSLEENDASLICTTSILPSGPHELVVNITSKNTHFLLDSLQYVPSDDALVDDATVIISNTDPSISYSPRQWIRVEGLAANYMTTTTGASVNISFIGDRISWFGVILVLPSEPQHAHSLVQYSVDHGPMVNFNLSGPSSSTNTTVIPNLLFFTADTLRQGSHMLYVRFLGNASTIPLTLNNLVVTNRSDSTSSPSSSTSFPAPKSFPAPTSLNSSTTQFDDKRGSTVGAVVGGVVGAIVGLTFMALLFVYCRRLRRRKLQAILTPFQMEYTHSSAFPSPAPLTRESGSPNDNSTSQRTRYDTTADVFTRSKYASLQREESRSSNSSTATSSSFVTSTTSSSNLSTV